MKTTVQELDGRLVAVLAGELDTAAAAETEAALKPLFESTGKDLVLDCADLHRELLEMARVRPLEEVRRTESFTAFASKVRFLRKRVPRTYGTAFGYPWNKRFYNGMTRDRFAELVHRGIDKGNQIGFKRGCWRTPTRYAGRSGVIEVPMLFITPV